MSRETQPYKRSFSGSIGAGLGSVFSGSGKQYYILEHKISSRYHKVGESQEIIIDNIEIGRDPKCQVRFDDSFTTVSRRHAAIVRDGDKWKLVQLSTTNPTFLNGSKVATEWYLQNGDEIQLSTSGPRLGFIIPSGNKSTVGSIGLSRRLSLFRQQALRPYKQAITLLSVLLVLAVGGLSTWMVINDREWRSKFEIAKLDYENIGVQNEILKEEIAKQKDAKEKLEKDVLKLNNKVKEIEKKGHSIQPVPNTETYSNLLPSIYYIRVDEVVIKYGGNTLYLPDEDKWSGTGFLLDDGRFITARHVIERWAFLTSLDGNMAILNFCDNNGGSVVAHFTAYSSSGHSFSFTSEQFKWNDSGDEFVLDEDFNIFFVARPDNRDWAVYRTNYTNSVLKADNDLSTSLKVGTRLTLLGFPFGLGANSPSDIKPIYGSAIVARDGLNDGVILTTDSNFENGNSGGPAFYTDSKGNYFVIGVVSSKQGKNIGFIVPIAEVR